MFKGLARWITIAVVLLHLICSKAHAQTESYIQTLTGIIHANDSCTVIDEKFADAQLWSTIQKNTQVRNLVTFEIRFDTNLVIPKKIFTCSLTVDLQYRDSSGVQHNLTNIPLQIKYDTTKGQPYKGIAYYKFKDGHEVQLKVKSISSPEIDITQASFLRIKNEILVDRLYKDRPDNPAAPMFSQGTAAGNGNQAKGILISNNRQMKITWDPAQFSYDKYDLEFTFYHKKSKLAVDHLIPLNGINVSLLEQAFLNNATRVSLNAPEYIVNLVFPEGYLLVRVRAYRYVNADGETDRLEGPWHYLETDGIDGVHAIYLLAQHESELTWQYSGVFAEEGKNKEVVSYFDGGLKSRQTVTLSNSDGIAIVQENILDKLNRPAISILPAPTSDNTFHFYPQFNTNSSGQLYSYANFNTNQCTNVVDAMSPSSGASQYYSAFNPFLGQGTHLYTGDVAQAYGFPFSVTTFTNDMTGRIRKQSGVGNAFKPGSGHETSYYYGKPSQRELDRLFGSEAGNAAHYSKNMVIDANGQVSVSYVDMAGKTIATSLAGNSPETMKALPSEAAGVFTIQDELIQPQQLVKDASGKTISFNTTILVPSYASYQFNYEFSSRSLELIFGYNPEKKLCADCYYDVQFSITDECGNPVNVTYNGQSFTTVLVPASFNYGNNPGQPNTSCAIVPPGQMGAISVIFPQAGEYKVHYKLVMSATALEYYMQYLKQANIIKTPAEFKKEYLKKIDLTGCFTDCSTCEDKIGSFEDFKTRLAAIVLQEENITLLDEDTTWIRQLYNNANAACSLAVAQNCAPVEGCGEYRKMMLKDVSPGGQYMLYDPVTLLFKERSINAFLKYYALNPNSSPEIIVHPGELPKKIGTLTEAELISNWKPEWAYLLLSQHPEYCLLVECEAESASRTRDRKMMQTDDDVKATTQFGWLPNNYVPFLDQEIAAMGTLYNPTCTRTALENRMSTFIQAPVVPNGPNTAISLMQFVRYLVYCPNKPTPNSNGQYAYVDLSCIPSSIQCNKPLEEWRIFRNLYLSIKQEVYRSQACRANTTSCTNTNNCYIGVNAFGGLYNEKADPSYYPKLSEFIIEENGSGGLQVKYAPGQVNNLCSLKVFKLDLLTGQPVLAASLNFSPTSNGPIVIPNAFDNELDLYFIESIENNYHHNLDNNAPNQACPSPADFVLTLMNGNKVKVEYIGLYPLLTKTNIQIKVKHIGYQNYPMVFEPLQTVSFKDNFSAVIFPDNQNGVIEVNCVSSTSTCPLDNAWPKYFQKVRRFYESYDPADLNTVVALSNNGSGNPSFGSTNGDYQKNCENMAEGWLQKLQGCFTAPINQTQYNDLKQRLIAVCLKGSDILHPFGSSTTPAGTSSSLGDVSFREAIISVFGSLSPVCNDLLIDFPVPYHNQVQFSEPVGDHLSDCGYSLLVKFQAEWNALGGANSTYPTLKEYIRQKYDPNFYLTDAQITELMTAYTAGCPLKRPIRIPGLLVRCASPATPSCINCSQLYKVQAMFQQEYGFSTADPNYVELLAGYINKKYSMNVAPTAMHLALQQCAGKPSFNDACIDTCSKLVTNYNRFTTLMPFEEYCRKKWCAGKTDVQIIQDYEQHLTTWINLTMGWNYSIAQVDNFLRNCGIDTQQPVCFDTIQQCNNEIDTLYCCESFELLSLIKSWYPSGINPKLLAYFFELKNYVHGAPVNLPSISYTYSQDSLINYFSHLVPSVIPSCTDSTLSCELWNFQFDSLAVSCGIYDTSMVAGAAVLCSTPLTPYYQSDPDDCLRSTVKASMSNAVYAYDEYVKTVVRDYREAYFAKCLNVTPSLVMEGQQKEYHYTLYYYDQSGNLVKTVPPAGVMPVTNTAHLADISQMRNEDNGSCYQYAPAPEFTNTASHVLSIPFANYPSHQDGPLTLEGWFKFNNTSNTQILLNQFDDAGQAGKAGYYAYLQNGHLYFNIFGRSEESWVKKNIAWLHPTLLPDVTAHIYNEEQNPYTRYRLFSAKCHTENLITATSDYHHIVFQYSGNPNDPEPVKIYVNGSLQTLNWTAPGNGKFFGFNDSYNNVPSSLVPSINEVVYELKTVVTPFTTASVTDLQAGALNRTIDGINRDGFAGRLKHLRIYHAAPETPDIRRGSYDDCYMPGTREGLVLWLPLNKEVSGNTMDLMSGNQVSISATWPTGPQPHYPAHRLPTYYAYNSLNQVNYQETPDAGISRFWYDRLGRLTVSQNAKQYSSTGNHKYSYTLYDDLGRIKEVGQKHSAAAITSVNVKDQSQLNSWLLSGTDEQITQTIYDSPDPNITSDANIILAQLKNYNSRKRVVTSVYRESKVQATEYNFATHYIYDISGNVKKLYQENRKMYDGRTVAKTKTIDYECDLISGKVNSVWYQKDQQDQYYYNYNYDADNRLRDAISGRDRSTVRHDARYYYYLHGPLARTELGHEIVQGVDYAYTLQGWLKAINGVNLNQPEPGENYDLGRDGSADDCNGFCEERVDIPADVYAYSLGYYQDDYEPIDDRGGQHPVTSKLFGFNVPGSPGTGHELFNGNIAYTSYANRYLQNGDVYSYSYSYDQLNRLVEMRNHQPFNPQNDLEWDHSSIIDDYRESISYDANGNILTYSRNGHSNSGLNMDNLTYVYKDPLNNNMLAHVDDVMSAGNYATDLDDQNLNNYNYDAIGNLTEDVQEGIANIEWTVYGKIRSISKTDGTEIRYNYDASGNRISKTLSSANVEQSTTYYYRDATGNVMGVYTEEAANGDWTWKEQHLYGSSRLGMWTPQILMDGTIPEPFDQTDLGTRHYELTNHLGNVMAVIIDKKEYTGTYWKVEVINANDYYPGGMLQPNRQFSTSDYRYGFNGKEMDNEVKGISAQYDYGFRIYDPRIVKFLSVDPLSRSYPWNSPYSYAEGDVIRSIDLDGLEKYVVTYWYNKKNEHVRTTIKTIRNINTNQTVNLNFKKANGQPLTTNDVHVRHLYTDGTFKEHVPDKDNLSPNEQTLLNKAKTRRSGLNSKIWQMSYDLGDQKGGAGIESQGFDPRTHVYREAQERIFNTTAGLTAIGTTPTIAGKPNGSIDMNAVDQEFKNLLNDITKDGGYQNASINITLNIENATDAQYEEFKKGVEYQATQLKEMLENAGVKNVVIQKAEATRDQGFVGKGTQIKVNN